MWRIHRASRGRSSTDALNVALADVQEGVVARAQLLALGVTPREIETRIAARRLLPVRPGVYAVGRRALTAAGVRVAAVLAAGRGARLAGWSGATQRGWLPEAGTAVDVAVPRDRRLELRGVVPRRIDAASHELDLSGAVPVHAPAMLLLDLAASGRADLLERAWRQAIHAGELDMRDVRRLLDERARAHGMPLIRRLHARRAAVVGQLRNEFELRMLAIIREAGLPEPLCNAPFEVAPGLVLHPDFRIPRLALVIEADGRDGHADVEFLLGDDERDELYAQNGHRTLRFGLWEARRQRGRVIAALRTAAVQRAWRIGPE